MKSAASFRQKRCRFFLCALALFLAFPAAGGDGGQRRQPSGVAGETPREVAASLGMGWNLGNQMDAFADGVAQETVWGNPPVGQAFFDSLSAAGFTSVRIPVTWMGHFGPAPDYRIEPDYLERVAQLVGYAKRAGLNVILNIHHDGADSRYWLDIGGAARSRQKDDTVRQTLTALWTQIARRFRNEGDYLVFESMNEIHDGRWGWGDNLKDGGRQYAVLNGWNQAFVRAVRATGGCNVRRFLAVPGYVTNIDLTVRHFRLPADTVPRRLMVAVHYYAPMAYTLDGKYSEWGHTASPSRKAPGEDEDYMEEQLGAVRAAFTDRGIPAYIGEMSCMHRTDGRAEKFRLYYLEYLCRAARECALAPFYWDNGQDRASLFDRATGQMRPGAREAIGTMRRALFSHEEGYTLRHVYERSAPPAE